MTRLEFLAVIFSLKALCKGKEYDTLEEVLDKIIAEAENTKGRE